MSAPISINSIPQNLFLIFTDIFSSILSIKNDRYIKNVNSLALAPASSSHKNNNLRLKDKNSKI